MATSNTTTTTSTNFLKLADLPKLMSAQVASLDLNVEKNQADNDDVLTYVNAFLDILDSELKSPQKYKEYVFGNKNSFVRSNFIARLELVASRILEKKAMTCSTLSLDSKNFYQEELNFFVDLYFLLVTSMIDITAIRKEDLLSGSDYDDVYGIMKEHMLGFLDFEELDTLRQELDERKDDYPNFPNLQQRIAELASMKKIEDGDFVFTPPRSVSDYATGDILVTLKSGSDISQLIIGDLPAGLQLDEETGEIFVETPDALKAGKYDIVVRTSDEFGGISTNLISLPIGGVEIAKYEVAPFRVVADYLAGDLLARPVITDDVIEIVKAEWGIDKEDIPNGVTLDETKGEVIVEDEDMLEIGTYPVRVILTNKIGLLSKHEFSLSFRQDKNAIYTFNSPKALKQYVKGDVVATVKDEDGMVIGARRNKIPAGLELNATGDIVVDDPKELRPGTHQFNLVSKSTTNVTSLKTLFVTINPSRNPFYYDTSNLLPIDELIPGDVLAKLLSHDGTAPVKVRLLKGVLPTGAAIDTNGDIIAPDPSKLVPGNYDLRFTAFVNGINPTQLTVLENQLIEQYNALNGAKDFVTQGLLNLATLKSNLNVFEASVPGQVTALEIEIDDLELQLQSLTPGTDAYVQMTLLIQAKQTELNGIQINYNGQVADISQLEADIAIKQVDITNLEASIKDTTLSIQQLKRNKWIRYEVSLVLTLEEDQDSAWHVEIPKDWDDYTDHEVIAQLIDCDGYGDVEILQGNLPAGLMLNTEKGAIEVSDRKQLIAGEYVIKTKSNDKQNGSTEHRLAIIIGGVIGGETVEDYIMLPGKPINNYSEDEILGYPYNPSYAIVSGRLSQGLLPSGVSIDAETGAIFVEDPDLLKSGVHDGIVIKTINTSGGLYYHPISISFVSSTVFTVTVAPPKDLLYYQDGENIVSVTVNQGTLQGVQLVNGELPIGIGLNSVNGAIFVSDQSALVPDFYQIELFMADSKGATDQQIIDFTIGAIGGIKATVDWVLINPIDKKTIQGKAICANPSILNRTIVSATLNPVPKGIQPITQNGQVLIGLPTDLELGTMQLNIELTDNLGELYQETLILEVIDSGSTATSTTITAIVTPGRDFHLIKNGDVLSRFEPEASVVSATLVAGEIPFGSDLKPDNGRVIVVDRYRLGRGVTIADISVQVGATTTSSATKLATSSTTQTAAATSGSAQTVQVTIANKPIPDFAKLEQVEVFLFEMESRLVDFYGIHFADPDSTISKTLLPLFDKVKTMATWLTGVMQDQVSRSSLRSGNMDSAMLKSYAALATSVLLEIEKNADPIIRDLMGDLYNEIYTTQLAIFTYRDKDITDASNHPVAQIIQGMDNDLATLKLKIDTAYMVNNALIIRDRLPATLQILKFRVSMLID